MQIEQPTFPLAKEVFVAALRTGHGRVVQHIDRYGIDGFEHAIVEACVTSVVYDRQIEAERAPWLASIIQRGNLGAEVIAQMKTTMDEAPSDDFSDLTQRSAILKELAAAGLEAARQLLYQSLARLPETSDVIGDEPIIALDGLNGMMYVARQLGRWLQDDPDFWVHGYLISMSDEVVGADETLPALQRAAVNDSDIASYLAGVIKTQEMPRKKSVWLERMAYTGAQVLEYINQHPKGPCRWLRGWGKRAASDQRELVFSALLTASEPEKITQLLRSFGAIGVPRFDRRLLEWLTHPDEDLRWEALGALAPVQHTEVRQLALQMIVNGDTADGVSLLVSNFQEGDFALIHQHLRLLADADDAHYLVGELLKLYEAHPVGESLNCLLYVYELSPCSTCRREAVEALVALGIAPEWVFLESAFDADPKTRALSRPDL